ncbi:hypothetical protein [Kordiimonas sp. SCSIO 12610]|uniref:hypothetical protein n=1 Tax=Kordiimonas sp. SCSIO 12610 TaxID=2829597 RepID=UPI00210E9A64|nr:hypothetical protein [Kordiimonas sp. SCSIO 12610]UTW56241.1 hypothetical protein KFF44_04900 [Kordiimonas sp. SCSIO 12610]
MKYLSTLLLIIVSSIHVNACMYFSGNYLKVFQSFDTMIEGTVTAVYINGGLVSTYAAQRELDNIYDSADVLLKIRPSKLYFGTKQDIYEINYKHTKTDTICKEDRLDFNTKLWGLATSTDGRLLHLGYFSRLAASMLSVIASYQTKLLEYKSNNTVSDPYVTAVQSDIKDAQAILDGDFENPYRHFMRSQAELNEFPAELLKIRHDLMLTLNIHDQTILTYAAMVHEPINSSTLKQPLPLSLPQKASGEPEQ